MKNYKHFSVADFISDEYFQSWILYPNAESSAFWNLFLQNNPDKAAEFNEASRMLRTITQSNYSLTREEISTLWLRIKQDFEKSEPTTPARNARYFWAYAAAIAAIAVVSIFFIRRQQTIEYHTAFGETRTIVLPDSSTVILNANSSLSFENKWNANATAVRQVSLDGEAYFSVVHKHNHQPFRVTIKNGVDVEVLGTTFNVYHRTADTKVVLNTGKISLSIPDKSNHKILMHPGELVELEKNRITKRPVNARQYVAWTEHKIILDQTTLEAMVRMARDNFGVTVTVAPHNLLQQTVSGAMPTSNNATEFLENVVKVFQLNLDTKNSNYLITQ